jgi:hypothetical protein
MFHSFRGSIRRRRGILFGSLISRRLNIGMRKGNDREIHDV